MIFDSVLAGQLYTRSVLGDKQALAELHSISDNFIKAIAMSVCVESVEDLTQEGHMKLLALVLNDSIDVTRSSLYTYLSVALRNHMIDHMRRDVNYAYLSDTVECFTPPDTTLDLSHTRLYLRRRFPSLADSISEDMAEYMTQAMHECIRDMRKRVIRTLYSMYPLSRSKALVVYHAAEIAVAAELLKSGPGYKRALEFATNGHEFTLIPEYVLITNSDPRTCPSLCSITGYALHIKNLLRARPRCLDL